MFAQVIQGQARDSSQLRAALATWTRDLASGATGWLGTTAGVSDDGRFVAVARFDAEDAARRNSERPEQDQWWAHTAPLLTDVTFRESVEVDVDLYGDPDTAGFVQVMQGRTSDPAKAREMMAQNPEAWAAYRPDVLGSVSAMHDDDSYTTLLYFTSEEEAREGERREPPPELQEQLAAMGALEVGKPTYLDLREPWLLSPR